MATYFPSSTNQRDSATMLYLREPLPNSYSEASVIPGNVMMFTSYASSGSYSEAMPGLSHQENNCIDIPPAGASESNLPQQGLLPDLGGSRIEEHDFGAWKDNRSEMMLMHPPVSVGVLQVAQNLQGQGLSLSLGTQIPSAMQMSQIPGATAAFASFLSPNPSISGEGNGKNGSFRDNNHPHAKESRNLDYILPGFPGLQSEQMKVDISAYGMSSIARAIPNSKYLKAAQQLLDEVVNVKKALKDQSTKNERMKDLKEVEDGSKDKSTDPSGNASSTNALESNSSSPAELSAAEKQDLQQKLTKLLAMLDEVDRRYKQYYHQMQIVVSSFDVIAGSGAAKPYTALALQTISRHFRCLRDAISSQIQAIRKNLGEQDASGNGKGVGISRLRYVDQQLRQQRALQQLGMMQPHAWRPQRGLPESSVSILRAWLFEHFLHPYPKDSDKIMLARQTGLTRSQVSNWFINARVRLWKPMVEEMYKEETGDAEMESSSSDIAPKATKSDTKASDDRGEDFQQTATSTPTGRCGSSSHMFESKPSQIPDVDMMSQNTESHHIYEMVRTEAEYGIGKAKGFQRAVLDSPFSDSLSQVSRSNERFIPAASSTVYSMSELDRFGNGGGVSLTLGLQHCENDTMPMSVDTHSSFVAVRGDEGYNIAASSMAPPTVDFDCMDPGNRQHQFVSSHLLHDFVA